MHVTVLYLPSSASISDTANSKFSKLASFALEAASFVIDVEISDAKTFWNLVAMGSASEPTPQPASHTVFSALFSVSIQFSTLSMVCWWPVRISNCTLFTSPFSEYILFHRLKPSLSKYSFTSTLSSTVDLSLEADRKAKGAIRKAAPSRGQRRSSV
jgi:hypothetical protein